MRRNTNKIYLYSTLVILVILLEQCNPARQLGKERTTAVSKPNIPEHRKEIFETVKIKKAGITYFRNGRQENVKANIAVHRDSLIAVSIIPVLGYEAMRILCTRDSIIVINRNNRTYYKGSIMEYGYKLGLHVGFEEMQSLLINELFNYRANDPSIYYKMKEEVEKGKTINIIEAYRNGKMVSKQETIIDADDKVIIDMMVSDKENQISFKIDYSDFERFSERNFPMKIIVNINTRGVESWVNIHYTEVIFNEKINLVFVAPENYRREIF